jgi:flagellar motility protein MotE (MotC chaperone)
MRFPSRAIMIASLRRIGVTAVLLAALMPAGAHAETIFDNFLSALSPKANGAAQEQAPAPPSPPAKPQARKNGPLAISPRARVMPARAASADRDIVTGAIAQAPNAPPPAAPPSAQGAPRAPAQPQVSRQAQAQSQPSSQLAPSAAGTTDPAAAAPKPAAAAAPAKPAAAAAPAPKPPAKPRNDTAAKGKSPAAPAPVDPDSDAAQFCRNITDAAADARFTWQVRMLEDLDKQVKESTLKLEAKRAEYEDWLKRREDFLRKVEDGVVEMYGRMRPDAAAQQIAGMTEEVAISVLMKLKPRTSSAILGEMDPVRAARLTDSLAGVRLTTREQGKTP